MANKLKALAIVSAFLLAVFFFLPFFFTSRKALSTIEITPEAVLAKPVFALPTKLAAKAALIYDVETGKNLYQQFSTTPLATASVGKVMTALLAVENLPPTTELTLGADTFPLQKMINLMLLVSSNEAAEVIATAVGEKTQQSFTDLMNSRARELGLTQTFFLDASGLDWSDNFAGGYSSAQDLATLFAYVLKEQPVLLEATKESGLIIRASGGSLYYPENTNKAVAQIPDLLASKTGTTPLAGANLVTVFDRGLNQPVVAVILGSTPEERFVDMTKLVRAAYTYYSQPI